MKREEEEWVGAVSLNVVVSASDLSLLQQRAPSARFAVLPNGVDVDEFAPSEVEGDALVFVGGTNWFPNLDALEYFCSEILPLLRADGFDAPVRWVGRASEEERHRYNNRYGVELTGYVNDVRPHMRDSFCHIVPLRSGGGTRLKILNSWAMGKPVVSTSVGCEGLRAVDGDNILIRDDPVGFSSAVLELARHPRLRSSVGDAGRNTAVGFYSWDAIGAAMNDVYLSLL
jgi:glycosyltransferase involved in cell wall biosynthesis